MDNTFLLEQLRKDILTCNLGIKTLIQDIYECPGPFQEINRLNAEGQKQFSVFKKHIDLLEKYTLEQESIEEKNTLLEEVNRHRLELTSTKSSFMNANVSAILALEKANKNELFSYKSEDSVRRRQKRDKASLVNKSSNVTDQLMTINKQLMETTKTSYATVGVLVNTSSTINSTQKELLETGSLINQTGKLLAKYGRRECTDKFIMFFAFSFFLACVFYIIQKRLF